MRRACLLLIDCALWIGLLYTSALVVLNTLPYFSDAGPFQFLVEKGRLAGWLAWRAAFFAHISGALVCLLVGPLMFSRLVIKRARSVHRIAGRVYVMAVLGWAAPAGLFLSVYAKGGLPGQTGFIVLGLCWVGTTLQGYRTARARQFKQHARWMAYSYALATSALSFRVAQIALVYSGMESHSAYVLAIWLSLFASILLGAWWSRAARRAPASAAPSPTIRSVPRPVRRVPVTQRVLQLTPQP
ncbi:MAG: DUF2306 domain-containing protein [Planctomycetota bacterium]